MGAQSTVIKYAPMQSLDTSTLSGSYLPLGSGLSNPSRIFKIINASTVPVTISTDGSTDNDYIPADGGFTLYDAGTNRGNPSPELNLPPTQFFVKGSAGTGSVYLVSMYAFTPQQSIPS